MQGKMGGAKYFVSAKLTRGTSPWAFYQYSLPILSGQGRAPTLIFSFYQFSLPIFSGQGRAPTLIFSFYQFSLSILADRAEHPR